jgi:hypothetical protein
MQFGKREALILGAVATTVLAFVLKDEIYSLFTVEDGPHADAAPALKGPEDTKACPTHKAFTDQDFDKPVATPDVQLVDQKGIELIHKNDDWFIVNRGTASEPKYQLFRLYNDGSIKAGQYVPDLSLLGPKSLPEVSFADVSSISDKYTMVGEKVPESEMDKFYKMPDYPEWKLPPEYYERLEKKVLDWKYPLEAGVGGKKLTDAEVERLSKTIFDDIIEHDKQPEVLTPQGTCVRKHYADVVVTAGMLPGKMVMSEYPLLDMSPEGIQSWVKAHELGHGLSNMLGLEEDFNKLPSWKRATILLQLEALQEHLEKIKKPVNGIHIGPEALADAISYLLRDPELVKARAPAVYEFIVGEARKDELLGKILKFP